MSQQAGEPIEVMVGRILGAAIRAGASDVHLRVGQAPMARISGQLQTLGQVAFDHDTMQSIAERMTPVSLRDRVDGMDHLDFSAEWQSAARFRVHLFRVRGEPALVLRIVPLNVPDFKSLRLPAAVKRIAALDRGLILVTGATGMGKSTSLASILDFISKKSRVHILSVEDPIEFVIGPGQSIISQREVGRDVTDFVTGLWAALREDPDIIFIGEIRDLETARVALQAAETGHLVLSAIHTHDAASTIEHLVNMFSPDEQASARLRLAEVLEATICQRLLPMKGRKQRILTCEVLLKGPGIQEWIRHPEKSRALTERIAQSAPDGMQTFDQDLRRLYEAELIDLEIARAASSSPADFIRNLNVI